MNTLNADNFLIVLSRMYKEAWLNHPESHGAKIYRACCDAMYLNGMPLLRLKAMYLLEEAADYVEKGLLDEKEYKKLEDRLIQY